MGACRKLEIQIGLCRLIKWLNITDGVRGQSWCNHKAGSANDGHYAGYFAMMRASGVLPAGMVAS